jgi:hypothetical protein
MIRFRWPQNGPWQWLLIAAATLSGPAPAAAPSGSKIPAGHVSEYGFEDIDLPITRIVEGSGLTRIVARGDIRGTIVGFEVDFPSTSRRPAGQTPIAIGSAEIRSLGAQSDRFIELLSRLYKIPAPSKTMLPAIRASVAGLEGDLAHVLAGVTMMKFFFDSGPENRYAEVFINVDPNRRVLEFHEKDPEYRKPLLLALTRAPDPRRRSTRPMQRPTTL